MGVCSCTNGRFTRAETEAVTSRPCSVRIPRAEMTRRGRRPRVAAVPDGLPSDAAGGPGPPGDGRGPASAGDSVTPGAVERERQLRTPRGEEAGVEDERSLHVEVVREDGMFSCQVAEWPGCFASGETLPELMAALEEALALYVTPEGEPELKQIELRLDAIDLRVRASPPPVAPAREQASAGPPRPPPRSHSPHRDWGLGRFDRRPHD